MTNVRSLLFVKRETLYSAILNENLFQFGTRHDSRIIFCPISNNFTESHLKFEPKRVVNLFLPLGQIKYPSQKIKIGQLKAFFFSLIPVPDKVTI